MTQEECRDTVHMCRNGVRKTKAHLELKLKSNIKDFYRYISRKNEDQRKCGPGAEWGQGT